MVHRRGMLILVLALLVLATAPPPGHAVTLRADSATVNVGDIFTIPISIAGAMDLTSFQFDLSFNASILQVTATGVTESTFFTQGDSTVFVPGFVDNTNGQVLGVSDALTFQPPVNGDGVLATIEFEALAAGMSPLTLSNVFLNLSDQGFQIAHGKVTVAGQVQVPEPTALALLGLGLAALGLRRWARRRGAARPAG